MIYVVHKKTILMFEINILNYYVFIMMMIKNEEKKSVPKIH